MITIEKNNKNNKKKKKKKIKIIGISLVLALLILPNLVISQFTWQLKNPIIPFGKHSDALVNRLFELAEKFKKDYPEMYYSLSRRVEFIHYFSSKVDSLMKIFEANIIPFMIFDPPIDNSMITNMVRFSVTLLQPLYIIAILVTSAYILFISGTPRGRSKAKETFFKLIVGLGVIMITLPIIQLLMEISHGFSSLVLDVFKPDPAIFRFPIGFFMAYFTMITFFKPMLGSFFLLTSISLLSGVLVVFSIRYLMIILLTIIFPLAVFFYSFSQTKNLGKKLLFFLFAFIFLPVISSLILGATSVSFLTFPIEEIRIFVGASGLILLIISPLFMIFTLNFILNIGIVSKVKGDAERRLNLFIFGER